MEERTRGGGSGAVSERMVSTVVEQGARTQVLVNLCEKIAETLYDGNLVIHRTKGGYQAAFSESIGTSRQEFERPLFFSTIDQALENLILTHPRRGQDVAPGTWGQSAQR